MPDALASALARAVDYVLLPPAAPLWCIAIGLVAIRGYPRIGRSIAGIGLALAFALSTTLAGQLLIGRIERHAGPALDATALRALAAGADPPTAIVILGGGARSDPRERPDVERPNHRSIERAIHGAWVAKTTRLPVLVSGGVPRTGKASEALLMQRLLESGLSTPVRWVEDRSRDTAGNARESAAMLRVAGHRRIVLVTHAYHMPRAKAAFERAGLTVVGAPHGFLGTPVLGAVSAWLPSALGVEINWLAAHEGLGGLWYALRGSSAVRSAPPVRGAPPVQGAVAAAIW